MGVGLVQGLRTCVEPPPAVFHLSYTDAAGNVAELLVESVLAIGCDVIEDR